MADLPDTPAGRQVSWFFRHAREAGRDLSAEEVAEHMRLGGAWTPEFGLERFQQPGDRHLVGGGQGNRHIRIDSVAERSAHEVIVRLTFEEQPDKPCVATFRVDPEPPHPIIWMQSLRDVGPGVVIREARESDGAALAELERRTPLRVGSASITYDRGDDFLAFARLMEDARAFLAEKDGEILGLSCGALHPVVVGGKQYRVMLAHHSRIPPENRKRGLFNPLNIRNFQAFDGRWDAPCAYTAVDNTEAGRLAGPGSWSFPALRGLLRCEDLAGPEVGRPATPDDAARVVEILNTCHQGEELYLPYTAESLSARLERATDLYAWERLWMTERAAVGVWPAGLRVAREEDGERTETVRATVLDHGFLPGAEAELEGLLRTWCGWLAQRGTDELAVLTSEGSPNYQAVSRLAARTDAFHFRMGVSEPQGAAERGLYVDAIYF